MKKILYILLLVATPLIAQKKVSNMDAATTVNGADLIMIVQSGTNKKVTKTILIDDIEETIRSWTTCTYNATTNIVIGSTTTDVGFIIHYISERLSGGPFQVENGTISLAYNGDTGNTHISSEFVGVDNGFDIDSDVDGTDIRLNIIVDNSIANDLTFDYKIMSKFIQ